MKDNKILVVTILILILIIIEGLITKNIRVELIKDFEYKTSEKGNSKECYKQNDKLYCVVEVEWYAEYKGE